MWLIDSFNSNVESTAKSYLQRTSADVVVCQEHRTRRKGKTKFEFWARKNKWSLAAEVTIATSAGSTSAGVGVATRSHLGSARAVGCCVADCAPGRFASKWVGMACKGGIHVMSIYLATGFGINHANRDILDAVAQHLASLRGPWVIGGDWNVEPAMLEASSWLGLAGGAVVAPAASTCGERVYDFFVVSKSVLPAVIGGRRMPSRAAHAHPPPAQRRTHTKCARPSLGHRGRPTAARPD